MAVAWMVTACRTACTRGVASLPLIVACRHVSAHIKKCIIVRSPLPATKAAHTTPCRSGSCTRLPCWGPLGMSAQPLQGAYERGWFQSAISKPGMTASPLAVLVATAADIAQGMAYLHEREAPCCMVLYDTWDSLIILGLVYTSVPFWQASPGSHAP